MVIMGFSLILSAFIFYQNDFEKPSILLAIISTASKHLWSLILAIVVMGLIFRHGWFIPNIMNYKLFRILGRISYAAFMTHLILIKIVMGGNHSPLDLNVATIVRNDNTDIINLLILFF
jgi:peptidoglycan/LPS O-acetylase OafA/YrhL